MSDRSTLSMTQALWSSWPLKFPSETLGLQTLLGLGNFFNFKQFSCYIQLFRKLDRYVQILFRRYVHCALHTGTVNYCLQISTCYNLDSMDEGHQNWQNMLQFLWWEKLSNALLKSRDITRTYGCVINMSVTICRRWITAAVVESKQLKIAR